MRTVGKYRLVEPLASGGMADLWRAEVTGAEGVVKDVALKLVRGEHAENSAFVRMFVQEARLAARLTHANVVQVFEFDQVGGRYYLAMELVRGQHLGHVADRARERGARLGVARAVHVAAEVAKALAYAHRLADGGRLLGLVHRDVSPHNVLVSYEGEVKLADFGIARAMNLSEATDPGTVKGKLAYMAPEQARGGAVDARADVFSLGVVLWELCTGRRLFARDTDAATLAALLGDEPPSPPSAWNEEVPAELDAAVLTALERDPGRRTASAQVLATALSRVLLQVTRSPEDVDLRTFMQRLFEEESARAATGAPAQEPTRVRGAQAAPRDPAPARAGREAPAPDEAETRTAAGGAAGARAAPRRRIAAVAVAVVATAFAGAGWLLWKGGEPPAGIGAAAAPATSTPTAPSGPPRIPTTPAAIDPSPPRPPEAAVAHPLPAASGGEEGRGDGLERTTAAPARAEPRGARPLESVHVIGRLRTPPPESGEGILSVLAMPWGRVVVNGLDLGESPQELRIRAGRHRVRVDRRNQRGAETVVTVVAGHRTQITR